MMSLRITVYANDWNFVGGASVMVPSPLINAFKPMDTTDEPVFCSAHGSVMQGSARELKVVRLREQAAKEIAAQLTEFLMHEMAKNDTYNGYKKPAADCAADARC